jgi:hypothetical protein
MPSWSRAKPVQAADKIITDMPDRTGFPPFRLNRLETALELGEKG